MRDEKREETRHAREPWSVEDPPGVFEDRWRTLIGGCEDGSNDQVVGYIHSQASADRIVECVNACLGIASEDLERVIAAGCTMLHRGEVVKRKEAADQAARDEAAKDQA